MDEAAKCKEQLNDEYFLQKCAVPDCLWAVNGEEGWLKVGLESDCRHHQPAPSWIAMDWNCHQQQQFWSTLANAITMKRSTYVSISASRGCLGQPSLPPTMPWTWSSPNDSLLSMGAMGKEVYREFRRSSEKFGLWARNDKVNALSKLECMFVLIIWNLPLSFLKNWMLHIFGRSIK